MSAKPKLTWRAHRDHHPVVGRRLILEGSIDGVVRFSLGRTFALKRRLWYVLDRGKEKGNPIVGHHRSRKAAMAHAQQILRQATQPQTPGNGSQHGNRTQAVFHF